MNLFVKFSIIFTAVVSGNIAAQAQLKKMQYRNRIADTVVLVNTQEAVAKVKGPKPLRREHAIGFRANTDGWNAYYNYGIIKKNDGPKHEIDRYFDVLFFQLEIGEKRHPKEVRDFRYDGGSSFQNPLLSIFSTEMFRYGKINTFYQAKVGVGYKKLIAGKPEPHTVSIHWSTVAGVSLGLLKPYYFQTDAGGSLKLNPDSVAQQLSSRQFLGGYGFRKGWDEIKIVPGLHLRSGLKFDYADRRQRLAGLEVGVNAEVYFQKIHQMAFQDPKSFFFNAYASFELGWKK